MSSRRGSPTQVASSTPFDNEGTIFRAKDTKQAITDIRKYNINNLEYTSTTLNGTKSLDINSCTSQLIIGTAIGYSVILPDAETLKNGICYSILNDSTQSIKIKDNGGTILAILNAESTASITLSDNTTTNGHWIISIISTSATGITSYNVTTQTEFSTTSTTPTPITGTSITPISGRYAVWFSAEIKIGSNNRLSDCNIFKDSISVLDSVRTVQGMGSNFLSNVNTLTVVSVDGTQPVSVGISITNGTVYITNRSLLLIRLGQEG